MGFLMSQPGELASSDLTSDARFPALKSLTAPVRALLAVVYERRKITAEPS